MSFRALYQHPQQRRLLVTGFVAFIVIGAVQAMYGPAFPLFKSSYHVSDAQVGLTVSLNFLGATASVLAGGFLLARLGYRRLLSGSALLLLLGCVGIATSPSWSLTLAAALLSGLGFGGIDIGLSLLFGHAFGVGSAAALNLINAMYGLGAVLGPLLIAAFLPTGLSWPFLLVALVLAGLLLLLLRADLPDAEEAVSQTADPHLLLKLLGFVLMYFLYVGAEASSGSWVATQLEPIFGAVAAARFTSLFWGALMVGRLIAAPLALRVKAHRLAIGAAAGGVIALALCHLSSFAPVGYALAGLCFAPIFPTGLIWLRQMFPGRAAQATSLVIGSANLGGVIFPPLIGVAVEAATPAVIPTALMVLIFSCFVTALLLRRSTRAPNVSP
jgi:fucose permease